MQTWEFPSSSGPAVYTTELTDDGLLRCDCRGWTFKRNGKPRDCKHTKDVAKTNNLTVETRGEYVYVVGGIDVGAPSESVVPPSFGTARSDDSVPVPMLAQKPKAGETFETLAATGLYAMEEKLDGHRAIVVVQPGRVLAYSRPQPGSTTMNQRILSARIHKQALTLPLGIYDGEVIVPDGHSWDVAATACSEKSVLVLFDLLEAMGASVTSLAYEKRRELLITYVRRSYALGEPRHAGDVWRPLSELPEDAPIRVIWQEPPTRARLDDVWARGGEGVVLKRLGSLYHPGWRSVDWLKIKKIDTDVLTIVGFKEGKNGPYSTVVVQGVDGKQTTVKTLDNETMRRIAATPAAFLGRRLMIEYQGKTPSGSWRHPMWDRLIDD